MTLRTFEDVVEHVLAGGIWIAPQTSAGLDTNGSPTVVVDRATPDPAGSPAFGDPFARSAAIPRRGQR